MKYMRFISIVTSFFELVIFYSLLKDELDRAYLYLTTGRVFNEHFLFTAGVLVLTGLILTGVGIFKDNWILITIASVISATLSCLWMLMFVNVILHDHFRTLTPLLAYLSLIKFTVAWYLAEMSKEMRLFYE